LNCEKVKFFGGNVPLNTPRINLLPQTPMLVEGKENQIPIVLHNEDSCINLIYYKVFDRNQPQKNKITWYKQFPYSTQSWLALSNSLSENKQINSSITTSTSTSSPSTSSPSISCVMQFPEWERYGKIVQMIVGDVNDLDYQKTTMLLRMEVQRVRTATTTTPPQPLPFYGGNREWSALRMGFIVPSAFTF
jgi:hypothetical protein